MITLTNKEQTVFAVKCVSIKLDKNWKYNSHNTLFTIRSNQGFSREEIARCLNISVNTYKEIEKEINLYHSLLLHKHLNSIIKLLDINKNNVLIRRKILNIPYGKATTIKFEKKPIPKINISKFRKSRNLEKEHPVLTIMRLSNLNIYEMSSILDVTISSFAKMFLGKNLSKYAIDKLNYDFNLSEELSKKILNMQK